MKLSKRNMFFSLVAVGAAFVLIAACGGGNGDDDGNGDPTPDVQAEACTFSVTVTGEEPSVTDVDYSTETEDEDAVEPIDISEIPEDTTGISDDEIKLGTHMPLSGASAALFGTQIVPGMNAYFDFINDTEGGVNGRLINLIVEDDTYDPSQTNQVVRKLVEQDEIFAMVSGLGTAQHSAVFEFLKDELVPDLFVATGATKFTDPITRTAFGYNPNYIQEGNAIGAFIAEQCPDAKLGLIIQNDDFGRDGETGIRSGIEGSNIEIVTVETYEAANTDMTAQVQRLQNAGADVIAVYSLPLQAASIMKTAHETLSWDVPIIVTGVVADPITIALAVDPNAEGVVTTAYLRPLNQTDDPGIQQHTELMTTYQGGKDISNLSIYGQSVAELAVEVLTAAGPDINRRNIVEAAESIRDFTCSVCLAPINLSDTDHRPIEAFQFAVAQGDSWVVFGDIISYESTP